MFVGVYRQTPRLVQNIFRTRAAAPVVRICVWRDGAPWCPERCEFHAEIAAASWPPPPQQFEISTTDRTHIYLFIVRLTTRHAVRPSVNLIVNFIIFQRTGSAFSLGSPFRFSGIRHPCTTRGLCANSPGSSALITPGFRRPCRRVVPINRRSSCLFNVERCFFFGSQIFQFRYRW